LCFGLDRNKDVVSGQIAHLDRNPHNNDPENLIWLCLEHHDQYDSRTSQSKGLSKDELRHYRAKLYDGSDLGEVGRSIEGSHASIGVATLTLDARRAARPSERRDVVGDAAHWDLLLRGVYASRTEVLTDLSRAYGEWFPAAIRDIGRRKLPVFAITGRSGDGKSVVLLQLAEWLLDTQAGTRVYQIRSVTSLPLLLDRLRAAAHSVAPAIVVIEDCYRVDATDQFDDAIGFALDACAANVVVITCGPTPEIAAFARSCSNLEITSWTMPLLTTGDLALFSDWFECPVTPSDELNRTILVEVLFASNVGTSLQSFARRFGERIRKFGVLDTVSSIVAINSLDLAAPEVLLGSQSERDAVERLARRDQLHFEWLVEPWGRSTRLVHRVIAWHLFEELSADPLRDVSPAIRLARVLRKILETQGLPIAFGNAAIHAAHNWLGTSLRFGPNEVESYRDELVRELLRESEDNPRTRSFIVQPLLATYAHGIRPACADFLDAAPSLVVDTEVPLANRIAIALHLSKLEADKQIAPGGHRSSAERLVLEPQNAVPSGEAALTLVRRCGSDLAMLSVWLERHPQETAPSALLKYALDHTGPTATIVDAILRWAKANLQSRVAPDPLARLVGIDRSTQVVEMGLAWAAANVESPRTAEVLAPLVRKHNSDPAVRIAAAAWVQQNRLLPAVADVLGQLLQASDGKFRDGLREITGEIINNFWNLGIVGNLIPSALRAFRGDPKFIEMATLWTEEHLSEISAGTVIAPLLAARRHDDTITKLVMDWLAARIEEPVGADVLAALINAKPNDDEVKTAAARWLNRHSLHPNARHLLATLIGHHGIDGSLMVRVRMWVDANVDSTGASQLWSSVIKAPGCDAEATAFAVNWAKGHIGARTTGHLLSTLLRNTGSTPEVFDLAVTWVRLHPGTAESGQLISTLLAATQGGAEAEELASEWVISAAHRTAAYHPLLAALIGTVAENERWVHTAIGVMETAHVPQDQALFGALAIARPADPRVVRLLRQYLLAASNGVGPRQTILETWIGAGGVTGPALEMLSKFGTERPNREDAQLYGIVARACAHQWTVLLAAIPTEPARAHPLCSLIAAGIPSVRLPVEPIVDAIGQCTAIGDAVLWRAVLRSPQWAEQFSAKLSAWLDANYRRQGYALVLKTVSTLGEPARSLMPRLSGRVKIDLESLKM